MAEIFYQDELITLYNCRCEDFMATCRDKEFDLACCDPPFGSNCKRQGGSSRHGSHGWKAITSENFDKWNIAPDPEYFRELFRVSQNQIIWGANYFTQSLPSSMGWIFWDKGQDICMSDGELAYTSFDVALRRIKLNRCYIKENGGIIHSSQKPVRLYRWLLQNYAKPGWTIFDSHAGSCSLAIACHDLGFKLVACELDESYLTAAVNRIKNYLKQPKWFKPITTSPEQLSILTPKND
jgi:site-specific DNA-methyltransferase (adenine-specific)